MTKEIFKRILEKQLDVTQYCLLCIIHNKEDVNEFWNISKIRAAREALIRKSLLLEINNIYSLTEEAIAQLNYINENIVIKQTTDVNINEFCINLHNKIISIIEKHTGKKSFINTSGKPLNSSVKELTERLIKFFEKYGNIPFNKIEKAILKYTEEVITGKIKYAQRILFFIWNTKNDMLTSDMLTYIENEDDNEDTKVIKTKELF